MCFTGSLARLSLLFLAFFLVFSLTDILYFSLFLSCLILELGSYLLLFFQHDDRND